MCDEKKLPFEEMPIRISKRLKSLNIVTYDDLSKKSYEDIKKIKGLGRQSISYIEREILSAEFRRSKKIKNKYRILKQSLETKIRNLDIINDIVILCNKPRDVAAKYGLTNSSIKSVCSNIKFLIGVNINQLKSDKIQAKKIIDDHRFRYSKRLTFINAPGWQNE